MLEWVTRNLAIVTFNNMEEVEARRKSLKQVVR